MDLTGCNLIAGVEVSTGRTIFQAVNYATVTRLEPTFHEAGQEEVDRALVRADTAFRVFRRTPLADRADLLRTVADEVLDLGELLIERAHKETGLPVARLQNERTRTVNQLRLLADYVEEGSWVEARIDTPDPARVPVAKPDLRRMLFPLGPVAVFGASNFPLALSVAGGDTASAIAAGCPVIFKAHPAHPGTSELTARAILRAVERTSAPRGVFSLVHGWSHDVGLALVRHPLTRAVAFTGSLRGGRALFDAAAARPDPIPVFAEMGSINPVFILPSALEERHAALAQGLAQSITLGVGQFCTKPGVIFAVQGEGLARLRSSLAEQIQRSSSGVMLYEGIRTAFSSALERAREKGLEIVATAEQASNGDCEGRPMLLATTAAHFLADSDLQEEIFGPVSILIAAHDSSELERAAEALVGQLTATIHGSEEELRTHATLLEILQRKAGRLVFNGFPTGVEVAHAMHHGGPYPASTDAQTTSVGTAAITRFARPVCFQNFPPAVLPPALGNRNELGIWRLVDGQFTRADMWAT